MTDFSIVKKNLEDLGYSVQVFATGDEAASYLDSVIDGKSVGIGGSGTVQSICVYDMLVKHNTVYWHWKQDADTARKNAMDTDIYLSSVNALAKTGEMVNIDGVGNRVASTLYGHKKVYYLIGRNKLTETYEDAIWRARNVAAPQRAQQLNRKTPCAVNADRCYNCKSPERVCRCLVTLWGPTCMEAEVILIDEDLGL